MLEIIFYGWTATLVATLLVSWLLVPKGLFDDKGLQCACGRSFLFKAEEWEPFFSELERRALRYSRPPFRPASTHWHNLVYQLISVLLLLLIVQILPFGFAGSVVMWIEKKFHNRKCLPHLLASATEMSDV